MLSDLWSDIRFGVRKLSGTLGFSLVVILTLALGISINTVMFSVISAILLQPLEATNPDELVAVFTSVNREAPYRSSSYLDYIDVKDRASDVVSDLAAYTLAPADLKLGSRTQHITAGVVSGNYFHMLGTGMLLGRSFTADEDRLSSPQMLTVITAKIWRERFSADPNILGKPIHLNKQSLTVVGVVDDKYSRLRHFFEVDLFLPASAKDLVFDQHSLTSRQATQFFLLGRLAPGESIGKAQARMGLIASELHDQFPKTWSNELGQPGSITVLSEQQSRVPPQARMGVIAFSVFLLAMVATVLLIACTNLANLFLARALSREKEIAVRMALGSTRWRLIRPLLAESLLLSVAGAMLALAFTYAVSHLIMAYRPPFEVSIGLNLRIDAGVLLFGLFITLLTTILFGLAPALHATRPDIVSALKDTVSEGHSRFSLRNVLIVAEVLMAVMLLVPTGLFLRSLQNFEALDLGFKRDHLALVAVTLSNDRYSTERGKVAYKEIIQKLRELPEVEHADVATVVPLTGVSSMEPFRELGSTEKPRNINSNAVGDDYFVTMGIPLLQGRQFSQVKGEGEVAVINAAFAKIFWPNQNPIGRQIVSPDDPAKSIQIVGMVGTGKYDSVTEGPTPILYRPLDQQFSSTLIFHVRTRVQPDKVLPQIVKTVQSYDINMPVFDAKTMEDALVLSVAPYKVLGVTFSIFGGFATALAFSGLYSLITFQANRRKREIGIRVALGATPRSILQLLAKQGMRLVIIGVILGVPASIGLSMLIGSFLFGVAPIDPITYVLILGMLAATTGIAIVIPAMGAMKVQPMDALRTP